MSAQSLRSLTSGRGALVRLGRWLGEGGQGAVHELDGRTDVVAKLYWPEALANDRSLSDRLAVMVEHRPEGWRSSQTGHVRLAWPTDTLWDGHDFVGFLMPYVEQRETAKLMSVADPHDRSTAEGESKWLRDLTWMHCLMTAANLARAVNVLHKSDVVFGDFNDDNVIVASDSRTTLVDCDSMQIKDPDGDRVFRCRVYREDFTAPELDGADLDKALRQPYGDCFNLAVHLHRLLLQGEHPFRGHWRGPEDPWPPEVANARRGLWIFAGAEEIEPRRKAVGLIEILPDYVVDLFREAFVTGASRPRLRPTAEQWRDALDRLSHETKQCATVLRHFYPSFHSTCPWCRRERSSRSTPTHVVSAGGGVAVPLASPASGGLAGVAPGMAPTGHSQSTPQPTPLRVLRATVQTPATGPPSGPPPRRSQATPGPLRPMPARQRVAPAPPRQGVLRRHPLLATVGALALIAALALAATGGFGGSSHNLVGGEAAAASARHLVAVGAQGERDWIAERQGHLWSWNEATQRFVPVGARTSGVVFAQSSWLSRYVNRSHGSERASSRTTSGGSPHAHSSSGAGAGRAQGPTSSTSAAHRASGAPSSSAGSPPSSGSGSSSSPTRSVSHAVAPPTTLHGNSEPTPSRPAPTQPAPHGLEGTAESGGSGGSEGSGGGLSGQSEKSEGLSGSAE